MFYHKLLVVQGPFSPYLKKKNWNKWGLFLVYLFIISDQLRLYWIQGSPAELGHRRYRPCMDRTPLQEFNIANKSLLPLFVLNRSLNFQIRFYFYCKLMTHIFFLNLCVWWFEIGPLRKKIWVSLFHVILYFEFLFFKLLKSVMSSSKKENIIEI